LHILTKKIKTDLWYNTNGIEHNAVTMMFMYKVETRKYTGQLLSPSPHDHSLYHKPISNNTIRYEKWD